MNYESNYESIRFDTSNHLTITFHKLVFLRLEREEILKYRYVCWLLSTGNSLFGQIW